jgi:hypothetical protein
MKPMKSMQQVPRLSMLVARLPCMNTNQACLCIGEEIPGYNVGKMHFNQKLEKMVMYIQRMKPPTLCVLGIHQRRR